MEQIKTGAKCRVCEGDVMADIESVPSVPMEFIPMGPGSKSYFNKEITFYCGNEECGLLYMHPPGMPDAHTQIIESRNGTKEKRNTGERIKRNLYIAAILGRVKSLDFETREEKEQVESEREELRKDLETLPTDELKERVRALPRAV